MSRLRFFLPDRETAVRPPGFVIANRLFVLKCGALAEFVCRKRCEPVISRRIQKKRIMMKKLFSKAVLLAAVCSLGLVSTACNDDEGGKGAGVRSEGGHALDAQKGVELPRLPGSLRLPDRTDQPDL